MPTTAPRRPSDEPVDSGDLDDATLRALGERIRTLRAERDLTLAALSARSGISVAMLSHIERGRTSPSLKLLDRLRVALGVPLARLFDDRVHGSAQERTVARAGARATLRFEATGLTKELLSPPGHAETHAGLEVLLLSIAVGGGSGPDPWRRTGEKAGYVLSGRFELSVGDRTFLLEEGDSFQFDSDQPHAFANAAEVETRVVWIIRSSAAG